MNKIKRPVKSQKIYDNCKMLSPEGQFMAHCSKKRMNWYLKRGLAESVNETTFKLTFEPKGVGNAEDVEYQLEKRQNKCIVCGALERLTLHHIVPFCYRKHFPNEYKSRNSFDVVCMCHKCHDEYERVAQLEKNKLCERFSLQVQNPQTEEQKKDRETLSLLKTLQLYSERIPKSRREEIKETLNNYFGRTIKDNELESLVEKQLEHVTGNSKVLESVAQLVLDAFVKETSLFDFILYWREHFLEHANPKYLSESWKDSYKTRMR